LFFSSRWRRALKINRSSWRDQPIVTTTATPVLIFKAKYTTREFGARTLIARREIQTKATPKWFCSPRLFLLWDRIASRRLRVMFALAVWSQTSGAWFSRVTVWGSSRYIINLRERRRISVCGLENHFCSSGIYPRTGFHRIARFSFAITTTFPVRIPWCAASEKLPPGICLEWQDGDARWNVLAARFDPQKQSLRWPDEELDSLLRESFAITYR